MARDSKKRPGGFGPYLLRRTDQAAVGALVAAGLVAMGAWWLVHGGWGGRLVEVDRATDRTAQFQIDPNAAGWPELAQLPGIGETLARRIERSRTEQGPFLDQEDLLRVRGIGPKTLEAIRPYLRPMPSHKAVAGGESASNSPL